MNDLAIFLNTCELGGAERSLLRQLELAEKISECHFFVPEVGAPQLLNFLNKQKFQAELFQFPCALYKISRHSNLCRWPFALLKSFFSANNTTLLNKIKNKRILYLNGNKVGVYLSLLVFFSVAKPRIIWHFRDYSPTKDLWRFLLKFFFKLMLKKINLEFVANSRSVATDWEKLTGKNVRAIYNPVDHFPFKNDRPIQIIGSASMLAPWKGVHEILECVKIYEKELKSLGVKKIKIYGVNIYQTDGPHQKYAEELQKLKTDFIEFAGNQPPQKIFEEIDLLIHSSLAPEPFGRVITEAFKSGTSVLSTGLGGTSELVYSFNREKCAEIYTPGDLVQLFHKIRLLITDKDQRETFKKRALTHVTEIEKNLPQEFRELLEKNEQQSKNKFRK